MIKILFDNASGDAAKRRLWGFGAYLPEYRMLFDTGSNGRVLLHNMQSMHVDVQALKTVFLSHAHWDHIGGIDSILERNPDVTLYLPASLSKHLIEDLRTLAKRVVIIGQEPQHLEGPLYSTGMLGDEVPEHSLIIDETDGLRIVTGCGHFGAEKIVAEAIRQFDKPVKLLCGGFHLLHSDPAKIEQTVADLEALGVRYVCPTHCTGQNAAALFRERFGERCLGGGVGAAVAP